MKALLALYFFMIAIIQLGMFAGIYNYSRSQKVIQASQFWLGSLLVSSIGLLIFGVGILGVEDISKTAGIFTVANTFFFTSGLLQTGFCISFNRAIDKKSQIFGAIAVLLFIVAFDWLRRVANFEIRTLFMVCLASTFYSIQILQVRQYRRQNQSKQLSYLQFVTVAELIFAVGRIVALLISGFGMKSVDQLPQLLILFTLGQLVMNTLSYIAIAGYQSEKVSYAKAKSDADKENSEKKLAEISELLKEKERLIYGLMKANKTAATGALSASIAHELNQPLGASNLNIQYLKMKLEKGVLNPELGREILDSLEEDNQRAATIVKSLRSIFTEGEVQAQQLQLSTLITRVLDIVKPELKAKNIQIQLRVDEGLVIEANPSEIEQVLLNLINNAIQALANSGRLARRISIEAVQMGDGAELSVTDNGDGVDPEYQPHLFELLSTTKQTGMGLGLWLCKHIITRYGGTIRYEDALGGGARFTLQFP